MLSITANGVETTREFATGTVSVEVMSTATFRTEIVGTQAVESASPFLLGRTVTALKMTKCAVVTTESIRMPAKPIKKARRAFNVLAGASLDLHLSKS